MKDVPTPPPSISCLNVCVCVCMEAACVRVGLVNGRGREDTCSIIRPDKRGTGGRRDHGSWKTHYVTAFSECLVSAVGCKSVLVGR